MKTREEKFALLHAQYMRAEDVLARAQKKWSKLRDAMRRAEKRLDKEAADRHSEIAGTLDIREVATPTKPELLQKKSLRVRRKVDAKENRA